MPETQNGRLARLLEIYNGIKPLLTVISALPLIPSGGARRSSSSTTRSRRSPPARARRTSPPTSRRGRTCAAGHADLQDRSCRLLRQVHLRHRGAGASGDCHLRHDPRLAHRRAPPQRRRAVCPQSRAEFKAGRDL